MAETIQVMIFVGQTQPLEWFLHPTALGIFHPQLNQEEAFDSSYDLVVSLDFSLLRLPFSLAQWTPSQHHQFYNMQQKCNLLSRKLLFELLTDHGSLLDLYN